MQILLTETQIQQKVDGLARDLTLVMDGEWVIVAILDGSLLFAADLMRALSRRGCSPAFESLRLSSYGDSHSSRGTVDVLTALQTDFVGKCVCLVDDVCETGRTLQKAKHSVLGAGAAQVITCVLAQKPQTNAREIAIKPDYVLWDAPDKFLVGYGLDDKGRYRGQPFISYVETET